MFCKAFDIFINNKRNQFGDLADLRPLPPSKKFTQFHKATTV